ncbi:MAG: hypothetical protein COB02_16135 [Candidatus Cloacimonadota bacterium]|nr:MAG: hypothetical protein COB02_16135 [Candidatus Cloacimonadota bacterium]
MINFKKIFSVSVVGFGLLVNSFSFNLFDSAKSLGDLDKLKEKLSKKIHLSKDSMVKYTSKTLSDSLGGIDLSSILTSSQEGFKSDLNSGVSNVVKNSLDFSKGLKNPLLSSISQSLGPFIKNTINASIGSLNMGEAASSLFKSEFFQENITGFLAKFISGNIEKGVVPLANSDLVQNLTGDFFKSPGFLESISSFVGQKSMSSKELDNKSFVLPEKRETLKKTVTSKTVKEVIKIEKKEIKMEEPKKETSTGWLSYVKSFLGF